MANLSSIITPTNIITASNILTLTNKVIPFASNTLTDVASTPAIWLPEQLEAMGVVEKEFEEAIDGTLC